MLLVNARNIFGIHHRSPATVPSSLRKVNARLSFSTREAISCVVVIQNPTKNGQSGLDYRPSRSQPFNRGRRFAKEILAGEIYA
jgi:hypothetical protein